MRVRAILVTLAVAAVKLAAATPEQRAREERLAGSLLAPCCYAQPVSIHASEAALRMRLGIARLVEAGRTDEEIVGFYKQQFGDKVYAPPKKTGWWVYLTPWFALLCGLGVAIRWLRRNVRPAACG